MNEAYVRQILERVEDSFSQEQARPLSDTVWSIYELTKELVDLRAREAKIISALRTLVDELDSTGRDVQEFKSIEDLGLLTRTYNAIHRHGIRTTFDVLNFPQEKWHNLRNFGKSSAKDLETRMHEAGYLDFKILS